MSGNILKENLKEKPNIIKGSITIDDKSREQINNNHTTIKCSLSSSKTNKNNRTAMKPDNNKQDRVIKYILSKIDQEPLQILDVDKNKKQKTQVTDFNPLYDSHYSYKSYHWDHYPYYDPRTGFDTPKQFTYRHQKRDGGPYHNVSSENETKRILQICQENDTHEKVSIQELTQAINTLNTNKAIDFNGITAENVIHASQPLLEYLQLLINTCFEQCYIPNTLKIGLDIKNATNYRGITVTPTYSKIIEIILKERENNKILKHQNPLQKGLTAKYTPLLSEFEREISCKSFTNNKIKKMITTKIHKYWDDTITYKMKGYSTLRYLKDEYDIGKMHSLLKTASANITEIKKIYICAKLATGTYILQSNKSEHSKHTASPICRLCNNADETIEHFILLCNTPTREPLIDTILNESSRLLPKESLKTPIDLITIIVNPYYYVSMKNSQEYRRENL
ncbi:unnamed protein product [Mytilus coruscus]|uniref:Reverse transcriptase domain-containing protein n=1 Tax=Mytilus coruscus TaxID=42192 RepID=A0A6J8ALF5_MYTCO|nr:unnamed protein product [Mytilus coruscus]